MERKTSITICDVLRKEFSTEAEAIQDFEEEDTVDDLTVAEPGEQQEIPVDIMAVNAEAAVLPVINDEHGRLSDIFEALETATGQSVIPFKMGSIAPEVSSLARHKIFEFGGERYAMSHKLRESVIDKFYVSIMKALTSGIPFREELNTTVVYRDSDYHTLALSEDEWTYVMARFRNYKEKLYNNTKNKLVLEILPERK